MVAELRLAYTAATEQTDAVKQLRSIVRLVGPDPAWFARIVTADAVAWIGERFDESSRLFEWYVTDPQIDYSGKRANRNRSVDLSGLPSGVQAEFLMNIVADAVDGNRATPTTVRSLARAVVDRRLESINHIDPSTVANLPATLVRKWQKRLEIASADPEQEWFRDDLRLAVVMPTAKHSLVLRMGKIVQPWLRDVMVQLIRTRMHQVSTHTLSGWVRVASVLSEYLSRRPDGGNDPTRLTPAVMDDFCVVNRREYGESAVDTHLASLSALLTSARALGFTDRSGLPASFQVMRHHYSRRTRTVTEDRGFPDATFRFLMGTDDLYGSRVLDLARSVPRSEFQGRAFCAALQLAANFGRRPTEVTSLRADRVRVSNSGKAELLYDNFKSGRERVWLPIDARAAEVVDAWTASVRHHYPKTAFKDLALFPAETRNPRGTKSLQGIVLSRWFRSWVALLEQSVILGHLHQATEVPVTSLVNLRLSDIDHESISVDGVRLTIPNRVGEMLIDFSASVREHVDGKKYTPSDLDEAPLFIDPLRFNRGHDAEHRADFRAVSADRFDALGDGWESIAAQYEAGGIPGHNLGTRRIDSRSLQVRLFRHTYLQHLVNLGTDIFLVQELADHTSVQTTIDAYVRVQDEKLREAVDALAAHRQTVFGAKPPKTVLLPTATLLNVRTNDCSNPQVLSLGNEGCEFDRQCFGCGFFVADPSHIADIKSEIHTCNLSLARLEAEGLLEQRVHHVAVLRERREGWKRILRSLQDHLDALPPAERESVDTAAAIVRDFRNRSLNGGINFGRKSSQ